MAVVARRAGPRHFAVADEVDSRFRCHDFPRRGERRSPLPVCKHSHDQQQAEYFVQLADTADDVAADTSQLPVKPSLQHPGEEIDSDAAVYPAQTEEEPGSSQGDQSGAAELPYPRPADECRAEA